MPAVMDKVKSVFTRVEEYNEETEQIKSEADRLWEEAWSGDLSMKESLALRDQVRAMDDEAAFREIVTHMPQSGESRVSKALEALKKGGRVLPSTKDPWAQIRMRTLELVNMWREELCLEPLDRLPKGVVGDSSDCVIARALIAGGGDGWEASVGGCHFIVTSPDKTLDLRMPSPGEALVDGFDARDRGFTDLIE